MKKIILLLAVLSLLAPRPILTAARLSKALDEKIRSVLPAAVEARFLEVPWRTDLMQARAEAQRTGKPLFLWIMEGHPLGCV